MNNYFSAFNSREVTSQSNYSFASTREFPLSSIYPSRQLEIAGQIYLLSIIPQNGAWRFQLQNKTASGLIPGGFKLRVLTEAGESIRSSNSQ